VAVTRRSRLPLKQQHARRLVAAAQQQQRAVKLARYHAAVKSRALADMVAEVGCEEGGQL
jgi:type II secretory pathway predicted ATPase ExeA